MTAAAFDDRLFGDAVMARVNLEPLPTPLRALRAALRTRDISLASGSVWTAWHLATSKSLAMRTGARLRNAALLAVLLLLLAISTVLATAGATIVIKTIVDTHSPGSVTGVQGPGDDGGIRILPQVAPPSDAPTDEPTTGPTAAPTDGDHHHPSPSPDADNPGDDASPEPTDEPESTEAPEPTDGSADGDESGSGDSGGDGSGSDDGGGGDGTGSGDH